MALTRIVGMTLCALLYWWGYRYLHWSPTNRRAGHYVVRVPAWLSLFCGRPLPDNQVELAAMLGQVLCFPLALLWIPLIWCGLDDSQSETLFVGGVLAPMIITGITRLTILTIYRLDSMRRPRHGC